MLLCSFDLIISELALWNQPWKLQYKKEQNIDLIHELTLTLNQ